MSHHIVLFSLFLVPAFADPGSQKSTQNLCSNDVSHKRQKRDWIWNQMHIKEEIDTPLPHHVGKITSSVRNSNAKYIIEGEYANTIFKVEETSGDVYAFERLDREKKAEYELTALIIDRTNNRSLERPSKFIIKVYDINDNAPVFIQKVFNGSVPEMSPVGTSVTKVTAVDADDPTVSGHATVTYEITTGGEYFTIDDSGVIYTKEPNLDRETKSTYEIVVQAKDAPGFSGDSSTATVIIALSDINDNFPVFKHPSFHFKVPENISVGGEVGRVKVEDIDEPQHRNTRYSFIQGEFRDTFDIVANPYTNEGIFRPKKPLDFETVSEYRFSIEATDPTVNLRHFKPGNPRSIATVTIQVTDVDEPPVFTKLPYEFKVRENHAEVKTLGSVHAEDPDAAKRKIRYIQRRANPNGDYVRVSNNGVIQLPKPLDREFSSSYNITVAAVEILEDGRLSDRESHAHVHVIVDDVNVDDHMSDRESPQKEVVLIDSLLSIDQYKGMDRSSPPKKHMRDIAEVAAAAEMLLPKGSSRITTAVKYNTPSLLYGSLREYQKIGLDWLAKLYRKNLNGILADEAGLGKTVQIIAFFAHLACNEGNWGPHLVVVRSCNILKWELELKRWCPGLKILLYFGSQRELRAKRQEWTEPNSFNVCITSYKQLFKGHTAFMKMRWKYLIVDEMQQIKNMTEKHWEALFNLRSQHRLLLIDTPLHNTLMELWTMVHFLIPGISKPYLDFPVKAPNEENQDYCHKLVIRLHRMIQPFILRRSKRDVEKQLTKKYEHVLKCRLSSRQKAMYEDVILQPGTQEALKSGHFISVLHVLMQLQRICNHPDLINPRLSSSSYVSETLEYRTASLVLRALERDIWKESDLSLFDLIGMEDKMTHYEAQMLPKQKVTRKLIEEIYSSPPPPARPNPVKLKPSRLFQPVQYGQKPEGRTVVFPSTQVQRTVTTATVTQQGQVRGRSPIATVSSNQGGEVVKIAQLASIAGAQGRIAQPETPVTLQFQGNKFTLSHSQLRQLTAGQPLQLQGSVLQIVSAPGQQYLRPQGPVVMQTVSQAGTVQNALNALGNQHQAGGPASTAVTQQVCIPGRATVANLPSGDMGAVLKPAPLHGQSQETFEEKNRLLKERLDRIFCGNERRCSRAPVYGRDVLSLCSLAGDTRASQLPSSEGNSWRWAGFVNCCLSTSACGGPSNPLREMILGLVQQQESLKDLVDRALFVLPAAVAAPPCFYVANPPPSYSHRLKLLKHSLRQKAAPHLHQLQQLTTPHLLQFPDLRLVQYDSGKLEALAVLLQKLKSEGRRVLILSQMILMLDILELFLNFHFLTFVRIDEYANQEQRQELMKIFNRDKRIFCAILSSHSRSTGVNLVEADTVVFYDNDLNPVMDAKAQEWCDRIGRCKDIHIYRLVSGNSVEEKLLKNGTKDLIREVAAQGNDYSMAFLTQQTIQELFEVHSPMEDSGFRVKAEEFVVLSQEPSPAENISPKVARPFIEALNSIEREDEESNDHIQDIGSESSIEPLISELCDSKYNEEPSQLQELVAVVDQLTPIEKYALNYLELFHGSVDDNEPRLSEMELKTAKKAWEVQHMKELKEREQKMLWEDEEELLTYTREDAYNKEYVYEGPDGQTEIMPLWTPPTPPQDDNDIYIDSVMCLMYDTTPIPESKLPPVYVRKERKRHKTDPSAGRKKRARGMRGAQLQAASQAAVVTALQPSCGTGAWKPPVMAQSGMHRASGNDAREIGVGVAQLSAFGPTKPFPCAVLAAGSCREQPAGAARTAGGCGLQETLLKKGTTFLSHQQFCLKAIQKQHSESQLPGLAVKFTCGAVRWDKGREKRNLPAERGDKHCPATTQAPAEGAQRWQAAVSLG